MLLQFAVRFAALLALTLAVLATVGMKSHADAAAASSGAQVTNSASN